jgi:hypothetical protein
MEGKMHSDETDRRIARQEFLEAVVGGLGGSACAPMPGTFIEMLEIAAMERRNLADRAPGEPVAEGTPLTSERNRGGMTARLLEMGKTVVDVAVRFRSGAGPRRLPV